MTQKDIITYLNPEHFKVDDRSLEDLILYVQKLSQNLKYYNLQNKEDGDWQDFFMSDVSFLLAVISKYDLFYYDNLRLSLIKDFDEFSPQEDKIQIFKQFFELLYTYFSTLNDWYLAAVKNNLSQKSSPIELELEIAIQQKIAPTFNTFVSYFNALQDNTDYNFGITLNFDSFGSVWKIKNIGTEDIFSNIDPTQSPLSSGLKKLILLYAPVYKVIFGLRNKAKELFLDSIENNSNHKAHTGLMLAFLKIYQHLQNDINAISIKHLDFYYNDILNQNPMGLLPKKMFLSIDIDENIEVYNLDSHQRIVAGQNEDGSNIIYLTQEEIALNNISITKLITNFLSRNNRFEYNSRYKLVSGIFFKEHCATPDEVELFNQNNKVFASLGEEQLFKTTEYLTMDYASIGFAIASPLLVLGKSNREINFVFNFTSNSIEYLSNLIIDISNSRGLSEEDIFQEIFASIFNIEYTHAEGWIPIREYAVEYPQDWSLGEIQLRIFLDKKEAEIDNYSEEIHQLNLQSQQPIFRFEINHENFYNGYSFLSGMEIFKIDIDVKVKNLKDVKALNTLGEIDINGEFEILGATPKKGASILIGSHELFCKPISSFSIGWEYTNLPAEFNSLTEFYKNYHRDITDQSFVMQMTALSDFGFERKGSKPLQVELFEQDEEGNLANYRKIKNVDTQPMKLKPNYHLRAEDMEAFSNNLETGFLKLELMSPAMGFGFDLYPTVYNEAVAEASSKKLKAKDASINVIPPNEPFSPAAQNISVDYESKTSLFFSQTSLSENIYEEDNGFFLLAPQGVEQTFSKKGVSKAKLIPSFQYEGELVIGLDNIQAPQYLNLLFEIKKSENASYKFSHQVEWLYSSYDGWKSFSASDIIYDETISLMKTGVISLRIPEDISNHNRLYNSDHYFIKACSKNQADQFSLIKSIYTNGISAQEEISPWGTETPHLPPNSAENLETPIPEILALVQPLTTTEGKGVETKLEYYTRVSELLRHKSRPVTKWDIERFVLSRFNTLSHVKCFSKGNASFENDLTNIKLLCLKKIGHNQNIEEVKLSPADMKEVKDFLLNTLSPFAKIEVVNPIFEDIWIKAKVKFSNISGGKGVERLNKDFFDFICPWFSSEDKNINLGGRVKKSEIFNFIKSRPYVGFTTGISIIHIKHTEDGGRIAYDSASDENNVDFIVTGTSESILVPRKGKISILDKEEYSAPEPVNFNELNIEQNFIITSGEIRNEFGMTDIEEVSTEEDETSITFKIKI